MFKRLAVYILLVFVLTVIIGVGTSSHGEETKIDLNSLRTEYDSIKSKTKSTVGTDATVVDILTGVTLYSGSTSDPAYNNTLMKHRADLAKYAYEEKVYASSRCASMKDVEKDEVVMLTRLIFEKRYGLFENVVTVNGESMKNSPGIAEATKSSMGAVDKDTKIPKVKGNVDLSSKDSKAKDTTKTNKKTPEYAKVYDASENNNDNATFMTIVERGCGALILLGVLGVVLWRVTLYIRERRYYK